MTQQALKLLEMHLHFASFSLTTTDLLLYLVTVYDNATLSIYLLIACSRLTIKLQRLIRVSDSTIVKNVTAYHNTSPTLDHSINKTLLSAKGFK